MTRRALVIACTAAAVVVGGLGAFILASAFRSTGASDSATQIKHSLEAGCNSSSARWAFVRFEDNRAQSAPVANYVLATKNCHDTFAAGDGTPVLLPQDLDNCFVALAGRGYWRDDGAPHPPTTDPDELTVICRREGLLAR